MKKVFLDTENIYSEIANEHLNFTIENLNELHAFIASKNKFYSEEELCGLIISFMVSDKNHIYDVLYGNCKKVGISCIWETTFEFKQVIVCIISYE